MVAYYEECMLHNAPRCTRLQLDMLSDDDFVKFFRFPRRDFEKLLVDLQFPAKVEMGNRSKVSGTECLMILLRRLTYLARYCDLGHIFGRSNTAMSLIFNHALDHVHEKCKHLLAFDWERLDTACPEELYAINRRDGSLLPDCVGYCQLTTPHIITSFFLLHTFLT